ncbi:kinase-like domain-containing protein [Rhizophagus irregularis DAOM 181602=DAOM 197198]|nr:kinase-like domain-containing protein [Rhizophagus irregularis DAOM 181602=DAOM 197198]
MSSQDDIICKSCDKICTNIMFKWCRPSIWKDGLLEYNEEEMKRIRISNIEVSLKCLINSQNVINEFSNEAKAYSIKYSKDGFATAIWKNGPLEYNYNKEKHKYERKSNKKVTLKCLNNSQNVISNLLNEAKTYSIEKYKLDIPEIYGISQNPDTKDYIIILCGFCENCDGSLIYNFNKKKGIYERSSNKEVILKCLNNSQSVINDLLNEVKAYPIKRSEYKYDIPKICGISQNPNTSEYIIVFKDGHYCKNCGKGGFATVYLAIWKDGPLDYQFDDNKHIRTPNREVALKCLHNSQNITNEFLNEVNAYSISNNNGILRIYGISQNPDTNNYIIVLEYANGGNLDNYNNNIIRNHNWIRKLDVLSNIVRGLNIIHENKVVHRDFHTGNILVSFSYNNSDGFTGDSSSHIYISDMGLCGEVSNIDKTKIYGVMPFVAPEVLRGKPYNQAADVYSFGMIMYHIATGRQPFANCAHDSILALNICNGIRPEINEQEAPKFYIDLMKNCWDPDPDKRPSAIEIYELNNLFHSSIFESKDNEIKKQIKKADEYRKANFLSTGNGQSIHPQACYTSRLLNQFTKDLSKDVTDCLDCMIND